jgi:hypothetical protein
MTSPTDIATLAALLRETGTAHHHAFAASDGDDPEWPRWYAEHLVGPLQSRGIRLTVDRLAAELGRLDAEHRAAAVSAPWAEYYAERLLEKHRAT